MGPGVLMYHYPGNDIMNGSLLTVESNHFCVLKSRGAILNVYETGQYPVETPQRPLIGSMQQAFYGGQSPWQYEALFVSRAKSVVKARASRCRGSWPSWSTTWTTTCTWTARRTRSSWSPTCPTRGTC